MEPYGAIGGGGAPPPATATNKVVKAVPKVDAEGDAKSGVQKFRVKLLAESGGQSIIDVLCQVCMKYEHSNSIYILLCC